ncbi:MAG: DMT family transporter [Bacteroidales bacterium]
MKDSAKGIIFSSITALMWGVLAIGLKVQVDYLSPSSIVGFRFFLPFVFVLVWMLFRERKQLRILLRPPLTLVLAALFLAFNYFGFMLGVSLTSPSSAQVFIQFGPFLFALSGIFLFHEKIDWHHYLGFGILTTGVFLFYSEQLKGMVSEAGNFTSGMIWTLFAGTSWAIYAALQKRLVTRYTPNQLNIFIYGLSSLLFLPFFDLDQALAMPAWSWWLLVFLGLNTLVAYGCFTLAVKYMEANKVSVIITLNPIITIVVMDILGRLNVGWIGHEHFTPLSFTGAVAVLAGAVVVIVFNARNNRRRNNSIAESRK